MAEKVLIYAGTTEGRLLAQELSRAHIACDVHVATEYGHHTIIPSYTILLDISPFVRISSN